jgi:hypothetical protein
MWLTSSCQLYLGTQFVLEPEIKIKSRQVDLFKLGRECIHVPRGLRRLVVDDSELCYLFFGQIIGYNARHKLVSQHV